jgi:hypothetical protein
LRKKRNGKRARTKNGKRKNGKPLRRPTFYVFSFMYNKTFQLILCAVFRSIFITHQLKSVLSLK